tara:strand:+ start:36 stop:434 length:399 start_codon:yes stop_codon:yes gene_type:complete
MMTFSELLTSIVVFGSLFILYFLPTIIAISRRHSYKWVILGINIFGFLYFIPWIVTFVWAAWPKDKSLIDPIAGNVTGTGRRNAGDTIGSARYGSERGYKEEEELDNIENLLRIGKISKAEYHAMRKKILGI